MREEREDGKENDINQESEMIGMDRVGGIESGQLLSETKKKRRKSCQVHNW